MEITFKNTCIFFLNLTTIKTVLIAGDFWTNTQTVSDAYVVWRIRYVQLTKRMQWTVKGQINE